MTYFTFLAIFLGIPIAILSVITIVDYRRGRWMPVALAGRAPWTAMLAICIMAFVYTTPWDNYLVASGVWWYDINLVTGIVFGWVPIEEYTFFLVQPIMTGLLFILLARYLPTNPVKADSVKTRWVATVLTGIAWLSTVVLLILTFVDPAYKPATYLGLELSWALFPVLIQAIFGADILWRHRTPILLTLLISTVYLCLADTLAIASGTWTIDPEQSLPILIGGILPIEEMVFFLITNTLVVLGMTLLIAEESQERVRELERYAFLRPVIRRIVSINPA